MADNTTLPGTGDVIADKDIGGIKYQRFILVHPVTGVDLAFFTGNNGTGPGFVVLNDVPAVGIDADDAVMQSANYPVYIGGRVRLGTASLAQAADGDARGLTVTGDGRVVTAPIGSPSDQGPSTPVVAASDTNAHQFIAAQSSLVKIALWGLELANTSANAALIIFADPTLGELGRVACPALPGRSVAFAAPLKGSAGLAMNYQLVQVGGALPAANSLYMTPLWYRTRE